MSISLFKKKRENNDYFENSCEYELTHALSQHGGHQNHVIDMMCEKIRSDPVSGGGMGSRGLGIQAFACKFDSRNRAFGLLPLRSWKSA